MNVKIIKTGKVETVSASYGMRLIEQGKAVLAPKPAKKPAQKETPTAAAQVSEANHKQTKNGSESKDVPNHKLGDT